MQQWQKDRIWNKEKIDVFLKWDYIKMSLKEIEKLTKDQLIDAITQYDIVIKNISDREATPAAKQYRIDTIKRLKDKQSHIINFTKERYKQTTNKVKVMAKKTTNTKANKPAAKAKRKAPNQKQKAVLTYGQYMLFEKLNKKYGRLSDQEKSDIIRKFKNR